MAADLFETYVVTVGATMVLIALLVTARRRHAAGADGLPLLIGGVCIITSIIGTYFVRLGKGSRSWARSTRASGHRDPARSPIAIYCRHRNMRSATSTPTSTSTVGGDPGAGTGFTGMDLFWCMLLGLGRHRR